MRKEFANIVLKFMQVILMEFKVSETMTVENVKIIKGFYLVIKIGDQFFSTKFTDINGSDIMKAILQLSDTKNIGKQSNLYIKGSFSETTGHREIQPIPFELNFYSDLNGDEHGS